MNSNKINILIELQILMGLIFHYGLITNFSQIWEL